jgi:formylglycine-generating enzyme required for sulfatase activity
MRNKRRCGLISRGLDYGSGITPPDKSVAIRPSRRRQTGRAYRLPSEAKWEHACRAGTVTPFHFGPRITTDQANFDGNYTYNGSAKGECRKQTVPVGSFPPNPFGLYDMHGNVWEWCQDQWHGSYEGAPSDGSAWEGGEKLSRVLRGGAWDFRPRHCRAANRGSHPPDYCNDSVGFRVCCAPPSKRWTLGRGSLVMPRKERRSSSSR